MAEQFKKKTSSRSLSYKVFHKRRNEFFFNLSVEKKETLVGFKEDYEKIIKGLFERMKNLI